MSRKREAPAAVAPAGAVAAGRVGVRRFRVTVGPWSVHARESVGAVGYPPVVLVHGVVVSGHYMVPTIEVLGRYRHVYAPDLPGFGRSGGPRAPMDIPGLAASLAGWMRAAGIEKADVVAHSFGCQIAAEFAVRNPERVGRLALLGPTGNPENRSEIAQIGRWALDCFREPLSVWVSYVCGFLSFGPRRSIGSLTYSLGDVMEQRLAALEVPTLVVRGSLDPLAKQGWVERMVDLLPDGRLAVIPDAPHNVNYKTPRQLVEVLLPFLDGE